MKKLLSVILTVAMLISCISPSLVTFAADEPALVIADASFDPAARDAKATTTVSIANNPGLFEGSFYLYYDSTQVKLNADNGAITASGEGYEISADYDASVKDSKPSDALEEAGVVVTDNLDCVVIDFEANGKNDYTGAEFVTVVFDIVADAVEGDEFTFGIVPGVGKKDSPCNADEDDVEFVPGVGKLTAVADPNTPVYEDKNFDNTTIFVDSVTVNKGVTTVEVCVGIDGASGAFAENGFNSFSFKLAYPKEFKFVSATNGAIVNSIPDGDKLPNFVDAKDIFNIADGDLAEAFIERCETVGYDWQNSDDNILSIASLGDIEPGVNIKETGFITRLTFEIPADKVGTYELTLLAVDGDFAASVNGASGYPMPVNVPFEVDNGFVKVAVQNCEHENLTTDIKASTCTAEGYNKITCDDCGETIVDEVLPKAEHVPGEREVVVAPTVDAEGSYKVVCKNCPEVVETGVLPKITAIIFTFGDVTAKYGDTVSLPINVSNNSGMFIATFDVSYDTTNLTFKGFTAGDVFPEGSEVIANEYEAGTIRIYVECKDVIDATANSLLGNLEFEVANDEAVVGTSVEITAVAVKDGIINVDGTSLDAIFESGKITVAAREAVITVGDAEAPYGKEVLVPVTVEGNPGMFIAILDVTFDSSKLLYTGFENGDVFAAENVIAKDYKDNVVRLYFEADGNADVTKNGVLGYLKFMIAEDADLLGDKIDVTIEAIEDGMLNYAGAEFEHALNNGSVTVGDRAKVTLTDAEVKYGNEFVVDFAIANNPGFFIGIFDVKYNAEVLEFVGLNGTINEQVLFSRSEGAIKIYVEATADADITVDDVLASLVFKATEDAKLVGTTTEITVEIAEIINYAGNDVELLAYAGTVTVLDREKIAVGDAEAEYRHHVKIPVTVSSNTGFWGARLEHTFDAEEFFFVDVESGLFNVAVGENCSVDGNTISVFVENVDANANVTEDGVLYYIILSPNAADSKTAVDVNIVEIIDANKKDVEGFVVEAGFVTAVPCDHSEEQYFTEVTKNPTVSEEGVLTYYCHACGGEVKVETIAKLEAIVVGTVEANACDTVKVPVSFANMNKGVWALGFEVAYDASMLTFAGVENGLLVVEGSAANGVVTVFGDAADMADVAEDGVAFTIVFETSSEAEGTYDLVATLVADNTINVAGENVTFEVVNGAVVLEKHEHTEGEPVVENEVKPTCTSKGSYDSVVYCSECGEELSRTPVEVSEAEHTPGEPVVENEVKPTCTSEGSYDSVVYCSVCRTHEISRTPNTVEMLDHTPGEPVVENVVPVQGCVTDGSHDEVVYCSVCETYEISRTPVVDKAPGHKEEGTPGTPPTCTEDGKEGNTVCTECGETVQNGATIPATNHKDTLVQVDAQAPTCTEAGWEAYEYCTACDYTTKVEIPATNHKDTLVQVDAQAPTCTEAGWEAYEYCTACDYTTKVEIPATKHEGTLVQVDAQAPTCTEAGWEAYEYCTACDYTTKVEIPATNHKDTLVQVDAQAPTCTEAGWEAYEYCTACDYTTKVEIPATNHKDTLVQVDAQAPTCTEAGWEAYEYCTACDYTTKVEIPATKHEGTLVQVDAQAPTCTEAGWEAYEYCTACDYTTKVEIPATNHKDTLVQVDAQAPTCTEAGWEAYEYCTACDYTTKVEIPATNHKDTLVQVDAQAPTCTEAGWEAYEYCTACDYTTKVEIPATKHEGTLVQVDAQAPTCTEAGWEAYEYCTACDYTTKVEIPATNHEGTLVQVEAQAPTETEAGWEAYEYCTACDYTTKVEIPPLTPSKYTVTVDGVVIGEYEAGDWIDIYAPGAVLEDGLAKVFAKWIVVSGEGVELDGDTFTWASFTMPACNVVIESTTRIVGDLNEDGAVTIEDLNILRKIMVTFDAGEIPEGWLDIDGDYDFTVSDLNALSLIILDDYSYSNYYFGE